MVKSPDWQAYYGSFSLNFGQAVMLRAVTVISVVVDRHFERKLHDVMSSRTVWCRREDLCVYRMLSEVRASRKALLKRHQRPGRERRLRLEQRTPCCEIFILIALSSFSLAYCNHELDP